MTIRMPLFVLAALGSLVGTMETVSLQFTDVTGQAGIHATIRNGDPARRWITEANGNGVAWLDYDNDGLMDLLVVSGSDMNSLRTILAGQIPHPAQRTVYLFHNLGNGKFEERALQAHLADPYWPTGVNAADYDNDGFTDILITNIGRDLLFHNNGDGTFADVSEKAGLRRTIAWHTGSAFGDFNGDGKLDLFVTGYVDVHSMSFDEPAPVCDYQGQHVFCGPIGLPGEHAALYLSNGDGTFRDATALSGIAKLPAAHGFSALTGDFNEDGKLDILVANDSDPNYLLINNGDGTFSESALDKGIAFNSDGRTQSNMGIAAGEFGHSNRFDVLTTTFSKDYFPLFERNPAGVFEEVASGVGLAAATMNYLGWGCGLSDFDNLGSRDFWTANGHVYPTDPVFNQPIVIFRTDGKHTSVAYSYPLPATNSYRGAAVADFDNDGRLDIVAVPIAGNPLLLRNTTQSGAHWLGLKLEGTRSNRDAIGAKASVRSCGRTQVDEERSGGSYLSRNDPRLHFGLGACPVADEITVRWPAGRKTILTQVTPDQYVTITEPK